jgi:hypothetical protein
MHSTRRASAGGSPRTGLPSRIGSWKFLCQALGSLRDWPVYLHVEVGEAVVVLFPVPVVPLDEETVVHIQELFEEIEERIPFEEARRGVEGSVQRQVGDQGERVLPHPVGIREPDVFLVGFIDGVLAEDNEERLRHRGLLKEFLLLGPQLAGLHVGVGQFLFPAEAVGGVQCDGFQPALELIPEIDVYGAPDLFDVAKLESRLLFHRRFQYSSCTIGHMG